MNNIDGYGTSGRMAWPPKTLAKQTALTGLFSNNPYFATATYGTTVQPIVVPENCQLQVNVSFFTVTPQSDGTYAVTIKQEQITNITNIGFNLPPVSQNLEEVLQQTYGKSDGTDIPARLNFFYNSKRYRLDGSLSLQNNSQSKQSTEPSIVFPPVIPLYSADDTFVILGAEIFFPENGTLGETPLIVNNGTLFLC